MTRIDIATKDQRRTWMAEINGHIERGELDAADAKTSALLSAIRRQASTNPEVEA